MSGVGVNSWVFRAAELKRTKDVAEVVLITSFSLEEGKAVIILAFLLLN